MHSLQAKQKVWQNSKEEVKKKGMQPSEQTKVHLAAAKTGKRAFDFQHQQEKHTVAWLMEALLLRSCRPDDSERWLRNKVIV